MQRPPTASIPSSSLVIIAAADHLLAGRTHDNRVLVLGRVRALDVAEGRVRLDDALLPQVLERHQVARLSESVQPAAAEGERAEVLVDGVKELLGALQAEGDVADVEVLHVVAALHVVVDDAKKRKHFLNRFDE